MLHLSHRWRLYRSVGDGRSRGGRFWSSMPAWATHPPCPSPETTNPRYTSPQTSPISSTPTKPLSSLLSLPAPNLPCLCSHLKPPNRTRPLPTSCCPSHPHTAGPTASQDSPVPSTLHPPPSQPSPAAPLCFCCSCKPWTWDGGSCSGLGESGTPSTSGCRS